MRSLADDGDDPVAESAADWVKKLRELEEEKKRAKQRVTYIKCFIRTSYLLSLSPKSLNTVFST